MSVPFTCISGTQTPMALQNPTAAFGQAGYGVQVAGGTACNVIPTALIDTKLANVVSAYTASEAKTCAFTPNYATAVDNCLDSRQKTDHAENIDARIDHYFGSHDTLMGRAYLLWDDTVGIVAEQPLLPRVRITLGTSAAPGITSSLRISLFPFAAASTRVPSS